MTCIVGVRTEKGVLLAGDSVGVDSGGGAQMRRDPKVFSLNKHVAIGYTSSFRMGQLLRFNLNLPSIVDGVGEPVTDPFAWAVKNFIPAARTVLKDGGYATVNNTAEVGGSFLLAVRDKLYEVHSDYQVAEAVPAYISTGSGEDLALGALFALCDGKVADFAEARMMATKALEAAVYHSAYVRPPFEFVETAA